MGDLKIHVNPWEPNPSSPSRANPIHPWQKPPECHPHEHSTHHEYPRRQQIRSQISNLILPQHRYNQLAHDVECWLMKEIDEESELTSCSKPSMTIQHEILIYNHIVCLPQSAYPHYGYRYAERLPTYSIGQK